MKAASLSEIRKQLTTLDSPALEQLCLALARYKKENKELLTYLLFEANDEQGYINEIKQDVDGLFESLPKGNVYFIKKGVRKVLRFINKHIRYSGSPTTELEVRIYFCLRMKSAGIPLDRSTVLYNLYQQQLKKIQAVLAKLPEDLHFDYEKDLRTLIEK
ncbi:MAG TPA: hypothetical protein VFO54_10850 [Chryseosolibacter sp.]|nr:hypothetical protein [Chryseosolibacter sp.]